MNIVVVVVVDDDDDDSDDEYDDVDESSLSLGLYISASLELGQNLTCFICIYILLLIVLHICLVEKFRKTRF